MKLAKKWRLQEELVERFSDNRNGLYEIESNTLLGYKLSKVDDTVGRLHARPAIFGRPFHGDGASRPRAGDVRQRG